MRISSQFFLIVLVEFIVVFFISYNFYPEREKVHFSFNELGDFLKLDICRENIMYKSSYEKFWGFRGRESSASLKSGKDITKKVENKNSSIKVFKKSGKLCISENCYTLVGIYFHKKPYALIKKGGKEEELLVLQEREELQRGFEIGDIEEDRVVVIDKKRQKSWEISMFDFNLSKVLKDNK